MALTLEPSERRVLHKFRRNSDYYATRRPYYRRKYPNEYVAVIDGGVFEHAKDLNKLVEKLKKHRDLDLRQVLIDHLAEREKFIL